MQKDMMYDKLYNDYVSIKREWEEQLNALDRTLTIQADVQRTFNEITETVRLWEFSASADETHKEGKINGKNAETRKRQTALFLGDLREQDPDFDGACSTLESTSRRLSVLEVEIEALRGKISFLRNMARMNAGLTHALAG